MESVTMEGSTEAEAEPAPAADALNDARSHAPAVGAPDDARSP